MFVEVTRNGEAISSELSKLFDGVYTVVIPRDDAWGLMNVSVQTKSKPVMKETFELDFGMPWFKLTGWKKMAAQQKEGVVKMAEQASSEGKRIAGEINQKTAQLKHQTQKLLEAKATQLSDNVSKQVSKLYNMSNSLRSGRYWPETASLDYIKRAQRQAVNVWSKVELGKRSATACSSEGDCGQKPR